MIMLSIVLAALRSSSPPDELLGGAPWEKAASQDREALWSCVESRIVCRQAFVRASVAGGGGGWFILDTGSPQVFIDEVWARANSIALDIAPPGPTEIVGKPLAAVLSLSVGPSQMTLKNVECANVNKMYSSTGMSVAGILGRDFFLANVVRIRYRDGCVDLAKTLPKMPESSVVIPIVADTCPLSGVLVNSRMGPKGLSIMFDTGSYYGLMFRQETADALEIKSDDRWVNKARTFSGDIEVRSAMASSVSIGRAEFADLPTAISGGEALSHWETTLGGAVLSRFTMVFDYGDRVVGLQPAQNKVYDHWKSLGVTLVRHVGDKTLSVEMGASGGAAGLRSGDILLSIDGVDVLEKSIDDVEEELGFAFERHAKVHLFRGHETIDVDLRDAPP